MFQSFDKTYNPTMDGDSSQMKNSHLNKSYIFLNMAFFAYGAVFLIGLITNVFVIFMIIKHRRMRTLTNRFLLNLAVSDLVVILVCLLPNAHNLYGASWVFGELLCRFLSFIQGTSIAVSVFTLTALSADRLIAIHKPMHSKLLCNSMRVSVIIVGTWVAALLLMAPLFWHSQVVDLNNATHNVCSELWSRNMNARLTYDFILLFLLFILPFILMLCCYVRISVSLWSADSYIPTSRSFSSVNTARLSIFSKDVPNHIWTSSMQNLRQLYIQHRKKSEESPHKFPLNDDPSLFIHDGQRPVVSSDNHNENMNSNVLLQHFIEKPQIPNTNAAQLSPPAKSVSMPHRQSVSQCVNEVIHSSQTLCFNPHQASAGSNNRHRSVFDFEHARRVLQGRRRVVKLLITLVIIFFITQLPQNILSIYIDMTAENSIPTNPYENRTTPRSADEKTTLSTSFFASMDEPTLVYHYILPTFQLLSLSNSAINPLCYCIMSHDAKNILILLWNKIRCMQKNLRH